MADLRWFQRLVNPVRTEPKDTSCRVVPCRAEPSRAAPATAAAMRGCLPRVPAAGSVSQILPLAPSQHLSSPRPAPLLSLREPPGSRFYFPTARARRGAPKPGQKTTSRQLCSRLRGAWWAQSSQGGGQYHIAWAGSAHVCGTGLALGSALGSESRENLLLADHVKPGTWASGVSCQRVTRSREPLLGSGAR